MWAALHVTQIACRVSLPKCQIPNSFNKIVLIGNSAPLVVCSNSSNDLCLNLPDKDLCWPVSVRSKGRRGGDKGKHDTETLVSHQNRPTGPLCHCCVFPNLWTPSHCPKCSSHAFNRFQEKKPYDSLCPNCTGLLYLQKVANGFKGIPSQFWTDTHHILSLDLI